MSLRMAVLLVAVILIASCDTFVDNTTTVTPEEMTRWSFLTFNAGLDPATVLNYTERLKALPQAIADTGADVVCLQEVWKSTDQKKISDDLKLIFPYRFYKVTKSEEPEPQPAACTEDDLLPMAMCYLQNCGETDPTDVVAIGLCLAQNCLTEITGIPAECRNCLIGAIMGGATDIGSITEECTTEQTPPEMALDGNNGLMLLSRYPLTGAKLTTLDSFYYQRAYISAVVTHPYFGSVEVICTQLTDAVGEMTYEGSYGTWEGETAAQAQTIIDLAPAKDVLFRILMGDLAAGPSIGRDIKGKNESVYDLFYYAYYYNPFIEPDDATPSCTVCADNPLTSANAVNEITSHVLFTNYEGLNLSAERALDKPFSYTKSGKEKESPYSDHYGIKATLVR